MNETRKKNIQLVVEQVRKVQEKLSSPRLALAMAVYIHACLHKQDPTAVAAGLQAAKVLDKDEATLWSPIDCIMGNVVSQHGFEAVASMDDAELAEAVDTMTGEVARERAAAYIKADEGEPRVLTEEELISKLMGALPESTTKH